jgi:hypothetical protein
MDTLTTTEKRAFKRAWLNLRLELKQYFNRKPDLQSMLFLIGIQELGQLKANFTKEEKQDLMHVAVCKLLSDAGYFAFVKHDADGWPHYKAIKALPYEANNLDAQDFLLKTQILAYFGKTW